MERNDISDVKGKILGPDEIPGGLRIAIYGSGDYGKQVYGTLRDRCEIPFFVDSFKAGECNGIPVLKLGDFLVRTAEVDLVVIASVMWFEIEDGLRNAGYEDFTTIGDNNLTFQVYTPDEAAQYEADFQRVAGLFADPEQKRLYQGLAACRCGNGSLRRLQQDLAGISSLFSPMDRQYLDFVDFSRMRLLVEGGIFDGMNTAYFLDRMHANARLYGFDPLISGRIAHQRAADDKRTVLMQTALWDREAELHWNPSGGGGYVGEEARPGSSPVKALSVDEFRKQGHAPVDFLKLDVEGAEMKVLEGARRTLVEDRPQLAISIYHSKRDFIEIPIFLSDLLEDYTYQLGHYAPTLCETIFYGVPNEIGAA